MKLSALLLKHDELFERFIEGVKNDIIKASLRELGNVYNYCNIPLYD